jgi:hypothetical protein
VALALRKVGSGISSVVFTRPVSHIYGTANRRELSARAGRVRVSHGACRQIVNSRLELPTQEYEVNWTAEIWDENSWLPSWELVIGSPVWIRFELLWSARRRRFELPNLFVAYGLSSNQPRSSSLGIQIGYISNSRSDCSADHQESRTG